MKEYGKGYSFDNLCRMSQFSGNFTKDEIMEQPVPNIPWGTIIEIMKKSKTHEEMLWYINETHKHGWSRSNVLMQFSFKAYERSLIEVDTSPIVKSIDELSEYIDKKLKENKNR